MTHFNELQFLVELEEDAAVVLGTVTGAVHQARCAADAVPRRNEPGVVLLLLDRSRRLVDVVHELLHRRVIGHWSWEGKGRGDLLLWHLR